MQENDNRIGTRMDPKIMSVLAYLTIVGWLAALVLNNPKRELVSFHLRQGLGVLLLFILSGFAMSVPVAGQLVGAAGYLLTFLLWLIGILGAIEGEEKVVPILGEQFQEWFKAI